MKLTPHRQIIYTMLDAANGEMVTNRAMEDALFAEGARSPDIKVAISYIRKAMKEAGVLHSIETIWGTGYRMIKHEQIG